MLHLSTDRLAALGDDVPTAAEAAHLASCEPCAREVDAYRTLVGMAHAERDSLGLPLTRWDAIASALDADLPMAAARTRRAPARWPLRAAAGLLLMAGGAVIGRTSVGADPLPSLAIGSRPPAASVPAGGARPDAALAFASVEDARAAQRRSEQLYQQAVAYLAQYDSTAVDDGSPIAYKSRLAALDRVISATSEAMREAPHDPVINGYYLTTLGQREATIRQLNTALPASLRLNSF
jgi:hypothetical protein